MASGIEAGFKALAKTGEGKEHPIIAFGGDGGTYDIGLQALSGAMERGHRFLYVCYDNEAYMNTGHPEVWRDAAWEPGPPPPRWAR